MRISVLLITVGGFIAALTTATVSVLTEPRDSLGRRIALPSSPLDWIVQAAREHEQGIGNAVTPPCCPSEFAMQREDLIFGMSTGADGQSKARIMSSQASPNEAMSQLAYLNATPLYMKPEAEAAMSSGNSMIA